MKPATRPEAPAPPIAGEKRGVAHGLVPGAWAARGVLGWIVASMLAVTAAQFNAVIGLAVAIAGGILLGILLFAK